jgi:hypothetical protein
MKTQDKFQLRKQQLREEVEMRKHRIHELTDQLEKNFGRMTINSLMPSRQGKTNSTGAVLNTLGTIAARIFPGVPLPGSKGGFGQSWQLLAAGIAFRFLRKMIKKKKSTSDNQ